MRLRSEKDLQRQVSVARSQLRELRTTADSNQARLFDHSQRQGPYSSYRFLCPIMLLLLP